MMLLGAETSQAQVDQCQESIGDRSYIVKQATNDIRQSELAIQQNYQDFLVYLKLATSLRRAC